MQTEMIKALMGAAGAGGDGEFIDELFSTYLWSGTDGALSANTGLDMSGEGGLLWLKNRTDSGRNNILIDSERGVNKTLKSDTSGGEYNNTNANQTFTSTGFTLNNDFGDFNQSTKDYCSWNFRKAPGFFDVVTWTGNDVQGRDIPHSLGSVPGLILVKRTDGAEDWTVYHRSVGATKHGELNNNFQFVSDNKWDSTEPTSSVFTVGSHDRVNKDTWTYVAYVFAHDDQSFGIGGDNSVIKCSSFTGNANTNGPTIDLGWEPQYIMTKNADRADDWLIIDAMRGMVTGAADFRLKPEVNTSESYSNDYLEATATGFKVVHGGNVMNGNNEKIIYIAIRRPDGYVGKPAAAATDVFAMDAGSSNKPGYDSGFIVDMALQKELAATADWNLSARLMQGSYVYPSANYAKSTHYAWAYDYMTGWNDYQPGTAYQSWMWKRHAGFDLQLYTGITGQQSRQHGMNAVPEMIWAKSTNNNYEWAIGHKDLTGGWTSKHLRFTTAAEITGQQFALAPTKTHWTTPNGALVNDNGEKYIALLFASVDGISKVGSYDGQDSTITVTTGFQPKFLIVKRISGVDGWLVFDTTRGWGSGNDYRIMLDSTTSNSAPVDYGAPTATGFTMTTRDSTNANGEKYIYYAHA